MPGNCASCVAEKGGSVLELLDAKAENMARMVVGQVLGRKHRGYVPDVLQNAKLKALQHQEQFRAESSYSTWFYRIAFNEAHMHLRQKDNKRLISGVGLASDFGEEFEALLDGFKYNGPDPEQRLLAQERRRQLLKCILQLTPKLRSAILRYATKDRMADPKLTNLEKSRVHRAVQILREKMLELQSRSKIKSQSPRPQNCKSNPRVNGTVCADGTNSNEAGETGASV